MSECSHNCGSCGEDCASRQMESLLEDPNPNSNIRKVIGVVSGKGGVGKSLITSSMAVTAQRTGAKVGILDADITGPSIPKVFGVKEKAKGTEMGILPVDSQTGIKLMSVNLLLENEEDPVIWRGPVIAGVVKQFWTDVVWEDVDYLFVDMPPGTGDVPLTIFQSIPVDGIIIVTSPQDLVSLIVEKAVRMAEKMNIPVLGLVENMSYLTCPDCGKKISIFGKGDLERLARIHGIENTVKLPLNPNIASLCDAGGIENLDDEMVSCLDEFLKNVDKTIEGNILTGADRI
ncbi:MAG: P-loop NTPase [Lachnospiraceae bacterium]